MKERRVLVNAFAGLYRKAGKKEKGRILNRFGAATGYHRRYAARLVRLHGRRIWIRPGVGLRAEVGAPARRRKRIYDENRYPAAREDKIQRYFTQNPSDITQPLTPFLRGPCASA